MKVIRDFTLIILTSLFFLLGCKSERRSLPDILPTAKLERISISPFPLTISGSSYLKLAVGKQQYFEAVGHYSDGSFRLLSDLTVSNWYSTDANAAFFELPGTLKAKSLGKTKVYAKKDGVHSNEVEVSVDVSILAGLKPSVTQLTLAAGQHYRIQVTGLYNDNTSADETESVLWNIENKDVASVNGTGLIVGHKPGETWLIASKGGIQSPRISIKVTDAILSNIKVSPESITLAKGLKQSLVVTGYYSDNTETTITDFLSFEYDKKHIEITQNPLNVIGKSKGGSSLVVKFGNVTSEPVFVDVTDAIITKLTFSSIDVVLKGLTQQLSLQATFSDGTELDVTQQANYSVDDEITATVSQTGLIKGQEVGDTSIQASITDTVAGQVISTSIAITVCNLAGTCLDIYDVGDGKLFTSSPSKAYLDRDNLYPWVTELDSNEEFGTTGPSGIFYLFKLAQARQLCAGFSTQRIGGRENWRLPKIEELQKELYEPLANMFDARGWSVRNSYWSDSRQGSAYESFNLQVGLILNDAVNFDNYVSCVSDR
ncbi:Ig-like domain-containing protein [Vibrio cholerae]|uniref:Ig-like domain-containing protein n=1 Tax=Vibrio cholerae TaxID=666 RepID=UPI002DB9FDC7|nr:Ig-like domain-containing protein [Vibrio cholerae]